MKKITSSDQSSLRNNRDWHWLWISGSLSCFGSSLLGFSLPLIAYNVTNSTARAGVISSIIGVIVLIFSLPGGAIVDRYSTGKILSMCSILGAISFGSASILIDSHSAFFIIVFIAVIDAVISCLFQPAESAALRNIVSATELPKARSINQARTSAVRLIAAPVGGLLLTLGPVVIILFSAILQLMQAACINQIKTKLNFTRKSCTSGPLFRDIYEGLVLIFKSPFLAGFLIFAALSNFGSSLFLFALNLDLLRRGFSLADIGFLDSAVAMGSLLGAIASSWIVDLLKPGAILAFSSTLTVLCLTISVITESYLLILIFMTLGRLATPAANASIGGFAMTLVSDDMQGRFASSMSFFATLLQPLSPTLGGIILSSYGGVVALSSAIAIMCIGILALLFNPQIWKVGFPNTWQES
ncbi:Enterobactin exporter EntS [Austwickia sp. TVS 96-490-7B]|nr:Enterobactin exporter EntS [Austwickia sp. TVS 96-490-7B]